MRFIIGGAYQGKLEFAMQKYGLTEAEVVGGEAVDINLSSKFKCINNYHLLVKNLIRNNENPLVFTTGLIDKNPDIIIIMNEIGNGIIPMEKSERVWREQVGKVGCFIAERAETVERIACGIPLKIKG